MARTCFFGGELNLGDYCRGEGIYFPGECRHDMTMPGDIYINDIIIGFIANGEVICIDLKPGNYQFHWVVNRGEAQDNKWEYTSKKETFSLKFGETKYLAANIARPDRYHPILRGSFDGVSGGEVVGSDSDWATYLEEKIGRTGKQAIDKRRIVSYQDLSAKLTTNHYPDKITEPDKSTSNPDSEAIDGRLEALQGMLNRGEITEDEYDRIIQIEKMYDKF